MACRCLFLLAILLLHFTLPGSSRHQKIDSHAFQFTSSLYNVSVEENARGKDVYAISNEPIRMGVPIPSDDAVVKFKIVEGEKAYFKAEAKIVGDFAFLRLRHRNDGILNRELRDRYEFLIKATCRRKDATNLETTAAVNLFVTDHNDAKPIFEKEEYRANVKQNIPPFTTIVQLQASDADIALNSQIYYSLVDSSLDFMVDPISGAIRNLRILEPGIYELVLLAEDRASRLFQKKTQTDNEHDHYNHNKAKTIITVEAIEKYERKIEVEMKPISANLWNISQIVAIARIEEEMLTTNDDDDDNAINVEIIDNEYSDAFALKKDAISENSWIIETIPGIRPQPDWFIQIKAFKSNDFDDDLIKNISVQVTDKRLIQFENVSLTRFVVNESVPMGYVIAQLKAHIVNGVEEDDEQIRYTILSSSKDLPFSIDEKSAHIRVIQWLDHEKISSYQFEISGKLSNYGLETRKMIEVIVADCNDHCPVFAAKWARGEPVAFQRDYPLNEVLLKVEALDFDSGENGHLQYELRDSDPTTTKIFAVNPDNGEVTLRQKPPEQETHWKLKIRATDAGWPFSRSSEVLISVFINGTNPPPKIWPSILYEPENKQSPIFTKQPVLRVSIDTPPGKVLGAVEAYDSDEGYAGLVQFGTIDKFFTVEPFTGEISVLKFLTDLFRSMNNSDSIEYSIILNACDYGQPVKCTSNTVKVIIIEANIHKPHFEKPYYRVRIAEDTASGTEILALSAQDSDYGDNGRIGYQIIGKYNQFEINENTGIVKVSGKLDRETKAFYRITVMAFDHGHPAKVAFVNITIILIDVNDNAPMCAEPIQKVVIPEDYPNNALVTCVTASDSDEGRNGEIVFAFDGTIEASAAIPFRIQESSGCIFMNNNEPFDYETIKLYNLSIEVMDNGEPMLSSVCTLLVELLDVNENLFPPIFDDIAKETMVFENMPAWTEVLALNAIDPDDPQLPVKYTLVDGDGSGLFTIDSDGILRTLVVLDRETCESYWLTIEASDLAPIPLTSILHVFVRVLDRNDHLPLPSRAIYFSTIPENSPENTVVVKVEAEDKDDFPNRYDITNLRYKIATGDPQSFFAIDSKTGYLVTRGKRRLDRETQGEHVVMVEICDQGDPKLCSTVTVVITVTDMNDNSPSFKQGNYNFNVPAGEIGELCRIFAVDVDEGENAQLFYNFTKADPKFTIDSDGRINTSEPLEADEVYELIVKATDMGHPQQTSSPIPVFLNVIGREAKTTNVNEKPKLVNENRWGRLSVSDMDSVGETIGLIEAEDSDGNQLWWKLIDGNLKNTFAIRCDTGELYLAKSLEFIAKNITEMHLRFAVSDGIASTEGTILIEITRTHRKRPEFSAQHYKIHVSKSASVGMILYPLKANVEQLNGSISDQGIIFGIHLIEDIAAANKIRVDPSSGEIIVVEPFDDIVANVITAVVYARFNHMTNYALLSISLYDETQKPPKFVVSEYSTSIQTSIPVGTTVLTVHAYHPAHSIIRYSFGEGSENAYFTIDEFSGTIKVASSLLKISSYQEFVHTIIAEIQENDHLTDQCSARIRVFTDKLERADFLQSSYTLTIHESTPPNTVVHTVNTNRIPNIRYAFRDPCKFLSIHPISGFISTKLRINATFFPTTCFVLARSSHGAEDLLKLNIKVVSENQHTPFFENTIYEGYIQENMPIGSPVLLKDGTPLVIKAIDYDKGINGLINYRIVSSIEPYFIVDYLSGAILTKAEIDFEIIKHWSFYIEASDSASFPLTSPIPALIRVTVRDVNDVPPSFNHRRYNATLILPTLRGATICELTATDADTVGILRYEINKSDDSGMFAVEEFTGRIYANVISSHYIKNSYEIKVIVSDGLKSDSVILSVHVVNTSQIESEIKFPKLNYEASVVENVTSVVPVRLLTVKAESSSGDFVLYSLLNPNIYFTIGTISGHISWTGVSIDREQTNVIQFIVQARLLNSDKKRTQCIVTIKVEDKNDCKPQFVGLPYEITIPRDAKLGDKVISVKAIDSDEAYNGVVRYKLKTATRYFDIDKFDGKIIIKKSLKDANFENISLNVIAEDQGELPMTSSASVMIYVVDRKVPLFGSRYQQVEIFENAAPGSSVVNVHAVSNVGGKIGYLIKNGNDNNHFKINFDTGVISVHKKLDREKCAFYNLTIVAIDITRLGARSESFVAINISDVNDNAPHFTQLIYEIFVSETTPVGSQILKVEAIDPDLSNSSINYRIIGPDVSVLSINSQSGAISLMKSLDFESKRSYKFKLTASDPMHLTSEADLRIHVTDANDIAPRFSSKMVHAVIENGTPAKHFITKLDVSDEDTVSNLANDHRFRFVIIEGDETLVQINESTGVLSLLRAVTDDDFQIGVKYFNISVSDGLYSDLCLMTLKIIRNRLKQRLPHFKQLHYIANVRENGAIGTPVITVQAMDGIAPLLYSFSSCNEICLGALHINATSGGIFTRRTFDYEAQHIYRFVIMVTDSEDQRAFTILTLNVLDENDNTPKFIFSTIETSVSAISQPGETIVMICAIDDDVGDELEYTIVNSDDEFRSTNFLVHPKQGLLSVQKHLNDFVGEQISLFVRVKDSANPPHQSEATVILNIIPADIRLPKFSAYHYYFSVSENASIGTVVGRLQQDSQQKLESGIFSSVVTNYLPDFPVSIKQDSGHIIVNRKLNYEQVRELHFVVSLHPEKQPSYKAVSIVTIKITDNNDNKPQFGSTHERIQISEDSPIGSSIALVMANDVDGANRNSIIYYSIEEDDSNGTFQLDQKSGLLRLDKELDRELIGEYMLAINAQDQDGQSARMTMVVVVKDVNDSPPQFEQENYFIEYDLENITTGQEILHFNVKDFDLYPNNITNLYIESGNDKGLFRLHGNSLIYHRFPRNSSSLESHLVILASDGKYTATAKVTVRLQRSSSEFRCGPDQILKNITEDTEPGTIIFSELPKLPESSQFHLTGFGSNLFDIEKNQAVIVRENLKLHLSDQFELLLRAEDSERLCILRFIVNVESVKKRELSFKQPVFRGTIRENSNATSEERIFVTRVEASDGDLDGVGRLKFGFAEDVNRGYLKLFDIDAETGVITAMVIFDREVQDRYELPVIAVNGAGLTAQAKVFVDVLDVNDNGPIFEQTIYHLRIAEDETPGKELLELRAHDGDANEIITYQIQPYDDDMSHYLSIDANSGLLKLSSALDFEQLERFSMRVIATDSGTPPLSSTCMIDIEILDVNDNPPRFGQPLYKATVLENMKPGTKVIQILANDPDSEHFGRVTYSLLNDAVAFTIGEDGWITTAEKLDREVKSNHRLMVKAIDGGTPPLSDTTTVLIEVEDENDNPPVFKHCNMTAIVQENVEPGHVILPISITDKDIEPNTGPYKLEISGDGSSSFAFDSTLNLITTKRLTTQTKKETYLLSVKVSDRGGLSTECPLTVYVKEESRHSPQANPLKITLNTYMGEFLGGIVGRITATDQDSSDMLRYSISDRRSIMNNMWFEGHHHSVIPFTVDSETGDIIGEADLLAGTYRFNVSVTDGKFFITVPVIVDVISIDQDALDHSVSIRIHNVTGDTFFNRYARNFIHSFSRLLNLKSQNIQFLSVQSVPVHRKYAHVRHQRSSPSGEDLDVLLTVSRNDFRGYHRPNFIRHILEENAAEMSSNTGLQIISVVTEMCRRDACVNGECRDRLYLDDARSVYYKTDHESFSAPKHIKTYECICRVGYGGKRCDIPIDKCSRDDQCTKDEICVPMNTNIGFECVCPPGSVGDRCAATTCGKDKRECSQSAEIGVGGDGFFQIMITNSMERRLELIVNFKTISTDAVIMHGAGNSDFHTIEIEKRYIQYRWNCGTGLGVVRISHQVVSDGKWHSVKISRRSRHVKLVLDEIHEAEGDSPAGSDVMNLYREATRLTFGAMVSHRFDDATYVAASDLKPLVTKGMIGCFGRISVDGYEIPKAKQGLYLYNTRLNCNTIDSTPCAGNPCENDGTCIVSGEKSYRCICSQRYSGSNCEIDLTPCFSRPCPPGVKCIDLHNDFYCSCPPGYTGKTCQLRGDWDPCSPNPCGHFGICIPLPLSTGFICNCSYGYSGTACRSANSTADNRPMIAIKIIGLIIVILLLTIVAALIVCICLRVKKTRKFLKVKEMEYETNNYNPRVSMSFDNTPRTIAPPPIPPRGFRLQNNQLSNYEKVLPTVQVRPFPIHEQMSNSSTGECSRSPSLTSSGRCRSRRITASDSVKSAEKKCKETEPLARNEELRKYGKLISVIEDDKTASCSSSQLNSSTNATVDGSCRSYGLKRSTRMKKLLNARGCGERLYRNDWHAQCDKRINGACDAAAEKRSERLKNMTTADVRIITNQSSSKVPDDDDYLTMRPVHRRILSQSTGSQKRPLLLETSDSDGIENNDFAYPDEMNHLRCKKPPPPAHNSPKTFTTPTSQPNRVYDEPATEVTAVTVSPVKKAPSASELLSSPSQFENVCNIDDSDDEITAHDSVSSNVHQTMAVL